MRKFTGIVIVALLVFLTDSLAGQVRTVTIPSPSMRRRFRATIVTPDSYRRSQNRYSVIYLLHGYSRNFATWGQTVPLPKLADAYQVLFVAVDGGYNSWYMDSPVKTTSRFATYTAEEVVAFIDSSYRTHARMDGRALLGSSMGGHGALTLLCRYPQRFLGAGSISGILDLTEFPSSWDLDKVLGYYDEFRERWRAHSFVGMTEPLRGQQKKIILDCGLQDFALGGNRRAHELLVKEGIAHDYFEREGNHSPTYVRSRAEDHIRLLSEVLLKPGL